MQLKSTLQFLRDIVVVEILLLKGGRLVINRVATALVSIGVFFRILNTILYVALITIYILYKLLEYR
jgi:hypothetical protein